MKKFIKNVPALMGIGAIALLACAAFAWSFGWIAPYRTTTSEVFEAVKKGNPVPFPEGYRRAHGKGYCFTGTFIGTHDASMLSDAFIFNGKPHNITGRLSIGAGNPNAPDQSTNTFSMALLASDDSRSQWRMAMNNVPFFNVRNPEGFVAQVNANQPSPITGKPDAALIQKFYDEYPEAKKYAEWKIKAPKANSWATTQYNSVNAFIFTKKGQSPQAVRWSMVPENKFTPWTSEQWNNVEPDYLSNDLKERIKAGSIRWDMIVTIAGKNDPVNDPSIPWPSDRQHKKAGTLTVTRIFNQDHGPCRDINFDPTIVPPGVELSDDPVLAARSGAYSRSFTLREAENANH